MKGLRVTKIVKEINFERVLWELTKKKKRLSRDNQSQKV